MYKVFVDDTLVCDSRVEELALLDPVVQLEENKVGSFSFIIPPKHPYYDLIKRRKSVVRVIEDDELVFRGPCIDEGKDFYKQKEIYCEGELTYFNDSVQRPARFRNVTLISLLQAFVASHNSQVEEKKHFQVGMVTVTSVSGFVSYDTNMEHTIVYLKKLVDDLGGFFRIRYENGIKYLDYLAESPNTNSQVIKLGQNLIDFKSNLSSADIATAIIPLGEKLDETIVEGVEVRQTIASVNDGIDYVFSPEAVENFGWIYKTVKWDGVTRPETLMTYGERYLSDIQFENVVIQAKAVDMHLADKSVERFKLSDQIRVLSAPHGMDRYFRLTKMTKYLNNPENDPITLGKNEKLSLSTKSQQENAEIKKAIESFSPNSIVKDAVANATQIIKNAMNGYITTVLSDDGTPQELLIMDTNDINTAQKVWRWNINGLGYSKTGYNGKYALAMTMDGAFVADFITVGTMLANRIKGGTLTLGHANNDNGRIEIFNSVGKMIGEWDCNGFMAQTDSYTTTEYLPKYFENNFYNYPYYDETQGSFDVPVGDYVASYIIELEDTTSEHTVYVKFKNPNVDTVFSIANTGYRADVDTIYKFTATNGRLILTVSNWFGEVDYSDYITDAMGYTQVSILYGDVEKIWSPTTGIKRVSASTGGAGSGAVNAVKYSYDNEAVKMCASGMRIDTEKGEIESDHYGINEKGFDIRLNIGEIGSGTIENSRINKLNLGKNGMSMSAFEFDDSNNMSEYKYMELLTSLYEAGIRFKSPYIEGAPEAYFGVSGIKNTAVNHTTTSGGANVRVTTDGNLYKYASSSKRYKKDITTEICEGLAPERLYDLNVVQYKYNDGYLEENDERCGKDFIGFIAEEVAEKYPLACNVDGENRPEMWEIGILFPASLKLVQNQKKLIDNLTERVEKLEERLGDTNG